MKKRWLSLFMSLSMILSLFGAGVISVMAEEEGGDVRNSENEEPADGNLLIELDGTFASADVTAVLNRINEIRYEAYENGYVDSYVEIKWSYNLEMIALLRAAEATALWDHDRPSGASALSAKYDGTSAGSENLAWNQVTDALMYAIEQFYSEKSAFEQYGGKDDNLAHFSEYGHYYSMINPSYTYVAMGTFKLSTGSWNTTAQEFSTRSDLDESSTGVSGSYTQLIEINASSYLDSLSLSADTNTLYEGRDTDVTATATLKDLMITSAQVYSGLTWSSSDASVATVDESGKVTAVSIGTVTITASVGDISATITFTVECDHSYGDPAWTWADDFSSASAEFVCSKCGDVQTVAAEISSETTGSCTEPGTTTYNATVTFNGSSYTDTKSVEVPATGHTLFHVDAKEPDCDFKGNIEYWYCSVCGKYFADAEATEEISEEDTVLPALGHTLVHHPAKAPTETEPGNIEYWQCSVCGQYFGDAEGTGVICGSCVYLPATGKNTPNTGDELNLFGWFVTLSVGLCVVLAAGYVKFAKK